jgi:hypothetical protein
MLADVLKLLPKLNQQELLTLKAAIEEFANQTDDIPEPPIWAVVTKAVGVPAPWNVFKNSRENFRLWQKHAPAIEVFLDHQFPTASKLQRHALLTFIVSSLIDDLKGRGVPITIGTIVKNLGRFIQVFEDQFPGYLGNGLAHMILRSLK